MLPIYVFEANKEKNVKNVNKQTLTATKEPTELITVILNKNCDGVHSSSAERCRILWAYGN